MRTTASFMAAALAAYLLFGIGAGVNDAQIVVERGQGGGGGGMVMRRGSMKSDPIYSWLNDLRSDSKWEKAREELVKKARDGKRLDVIFAVETYRQFQKDSVMQERTQFVIDDLTQAKLYPITPADVTEMINAAKTLLEQLEEKNSAGQLPSNTIRTLHSTGKMLRTALEGIDSEGK